MSEQERAITGWLKQTAALGQQLPGAIPDWNFFKLGTEEFVYRMTPTFTAIWDKAGAQFAHQIGLDPNQWDVTNPYLSQKIHNATFAFCEDTNATTTKDIGKAYADLRDALHQGLVPHGESIPQLTKRVQGVFENAEKWRARRIAQTETSRAMFQAKDEQARRSNVVVGWRWSLSSDACPVCVAIAARKPVVKLGEPFAIIGKNPTYSTIYHPPAHPHCLLPETPVIAPIGIAGIKARYDGPVVRLRFSDRSDVTVTPHHMLLTPDGFSLADSLVEGEYVLSHGIGKSMTSRYPHDNGMPTPISEIFDTWAKSDSVAAGSVPPSSEYLHGDAAFCKGNIDVVTPNRLLWHSLCAESFEPFLDGSLRWPHLNRTFLARESDLAKMLFALRDATDGGVCSLRESKALLRAQLSLAIKSSSRAAPWLNAQLQQAIADSRTSDTEKLRDIQLRHSGQIEAAQLLKIDRFHYSGPVYDVQTATSLYLSGNGLINSNCNCSVVPILDTDPAQAYTDRPLEQPAPATDEEADKIRSQLREEEEEILRGSEAWGAKPYAQRYPRGRKGYRIPFYSIKSHAKARSKLFRMPV
jgi:hypothetical protein